MAALDLKTLCLLLSLFALGAASLEDGACEADTCPEVAAARASVLLQTAKKQDIKKAASHDRDHHVAHTKQHVQTSLQSFSRLAERIAPNGYCSGHPCRASLLQSPPLNQMIEEKHGSSSGKSASLSESGYQKVAALRDDTQMADFIQRVIEKYDCKIESVGGMMGIVPWFSGTTMVQSMKQLEDTLLSAVLTNSHSSKPWLSYKNSAGLTGDDAELSFVGYVVVAALRSDLEMKKFAKRVCDNMGIQIVDEGGFDGMVKYYSGTDNFQSFDRLQLEVKSAASTPHTWAEWLPNRRPKAMLAQQEVKTRPRKVSTGFSLLAMDKPHGFCSGYPCNALAQVSSHHGGLVQNSPKSSRTANKQEVGKSASLDQAGYAQVAALKSDEQMMDYILRMIEKYDCKVEDIGGLTGIVPWFSGTTATQDIEKLENTLLYAVLSFTKKPWLTYKNSDHVTGDSAQLNFVGYVQVAAMRNDTEMKAFVRRVCKDMGIKIIDEGGFTGMVKYYSGTDNFQSYDGLLSEVKSAANAPHSWATKMS